VESWEKKKKLFYLILGNQLLWNCRVSLEKSMFFIDLGKDISLLFVVCFGLKWKWTVL
jgi:hypothetical protein